MSAFVAESVSRSFGGVRAVCEVSFSLEKGERHLIIGPNGAGKTTLFNILSGALPASSGRTFLFGRDITGLPANERALLGIGRTFQITNLMSELSVLENVLLALQPAEKAILSIFRRMMGNKALVRDAYALLEQWGLSDIAGRTASLISYGQKRQVDLILAMARRPAILLLDEPTAGLSAAEVVRATEKIRTLPKDMTVMMIEHDMDVAFRLADRVTVMNQGTVIAHGDVETVRNLPEVNAIYLGADDHA
jgi:branched-chain amino acid transport system ATP-binding protein